MNKHLKRFLIMFSVLIVTIAGWVTYTAIETRTLSRNVDEHVEVFVPHGMADEFDEMMPLGGIGLDMQTTWIYHLSDKEKQQLEKELKSDKWTKAETKNGIYTYGYSIEKEQLSDEVYCYVYDFKNKKSSSLEEVGLNYQLFVYDKESGKYYCHMSVE
ncbi:MAG: hypothetical protein NC122_08985 [Faecalibacterium sp.]|nr:hypothetical protein [Ruminococcus sp.]MCM1392841.1 hypothetical protein [Ruminococcus sp.]MCM1486329.1 hypothetical protein [Faecalibacterium sp.]